MIRVAIAISLRLLATTVAALIIVQYMLSMAVASTGGCG